ncbi:hypothetical protein [Arcticibacter eurypsychrophilus]|uniref:hypothetical protein n=1 Tax=Arcticibacter eurypsychrophilus TaxID=1434752 RepID=UPI00084D55BB|nr:hypothetical protein [Arcticibacter eurypsychrophilus]
MEDGLYEEDVLKLATGDQLIIVSDGMIDFEESDGKKTDYNLFLNKLKPVLGKEDTYMQIKKKMFSDSPKRAVVDDRSLIFIQKVEEQY